MTGDQGQDGNTGPKGPKVNLFLSFFGLAQEKGQTSLGTNHMPLSAEMNTRLSSSALGCTHLKFDA